MKEIMIISAAFVAIVLIVFTYFLFRIWNRCAKLKNTILQVRENSTGESITMYVDKLQQLERRLGELKSQVDKLQKQEFSEKISHNDSEQPERSQSKENLDIRFFGSKQGTILLEEVSTENIAVFKVFNIKDNEAKFIYCGGIQNPDWFGEIPNKSKIDTITPGIVKKDSSNNWVVTIPAKIKFV
jgi:cell division protein FtsB